ncbi:MAG: ATP-binding protein [Solirubrobacteraceae bacterium]
MPASERTRIQLCGHLSVELDGVQIVGTLRGKQVPLLLAYLVLSGDRVVSRDELIGALWPDRAPASEDASLRTLLSRLRSALGSGVLAGRDQVELRLPPPVWVDFEAARIGVENARSMLERGDHRSAWALVQVPLNIAARGLLPGAQATWLEPWRRELADVRLAALELIGRAGLGLGGRQLASVQRAARSLIELEPYRESGYVLLIEAFAAEGNIAEGLRVFEQLRTLLRDELGTAPSPEALGAHERLLHPPVRQRSRAGIEGSGPRARVELPAELRGRDARPLVGRSSEVDRLLAIWDGATGDAEQAESDSHAGVGERPRVMLLAGDAGIGKSRLIAELARRAHAAGAIVLAGRSPQESLVPYQPFIEALRHYVLSVPFEQLGASARDSGVELARLLPELRRRLPELAGAPLADAATERYRLFEAVIELLSEISSSAPVLLVLDDLHWADRPTLMLLRHLARAPDPGRVLVLGAYRTSEVGEGAFAQSLSELRGQRLLTAVPLGGLEEVQTAELVENLTGVTPAASLISALQANTEGNPFFVEELVRHLSESGVSLERAGPRELEHVGLPEGVQDVIASRLGQLPEHTLSCLRCAAVIGRDFDLSLLQRVTALADDEFIVAVDVATAAGLIAETSTVTARCSFSHALIRETLYGAMSAARRAHLHRRVAEALESAGSEHQLGALALHFARAATPENAETVISYALRAAHQASEMLAHEEVVEHLARALELQARFGAPDPAHRCERMLELGEACVRAGDRVAAWKVFREAASLAAPRGDSERVARAAIGAARRYLQPPGVVDEELIELLEQALSMTGGERTVMRVRLLARLCGALYYSARRARMSELAVEAEVIAAELDDPEALALAAAARRRAFWGPGQLESRLSDSTEMLTLARRAENSDLVMQAHAWLVLDLLERGEVEAVDAQIEAFGAGSAQLREPVYVWQTAVWRTMRALLDGRLAEADRRATEALAAGAEPEAVTAPQYYAIQLLTIRREQGRIGELEQPARQFVAGNPGRAAWRAALLTLLWESGRLEEAAAELDLLAARDFADIRRDGDWLVTMTLLAEACSELGDTDRGARLYELMLPFRESNVVVGFAAACLGSAASYLGRLAAMLELRADAVAHLEHALAAETRLRAPAYRARTQLELARVVEDPRRARGLLDDAAETVRALQLPALARRLERVNPSS